ncbi:MAG: hypothetical protein AAF493_10430 [Pseudomonadota bacterium]
MVESLIVARTESPVRVWTNEQLHVLADKHDGTRGGRDWWALGAVRGREGIDVCLVAAGADTVLVVRARAGRFSARSIGEFGSGG